MAVIDHPVSLIVLLMGLSLLPLFAVIGTSFLKLAVVFSLFRNALGIQQIPPNMAIYGLALILTVFTMAPVATAINDNLTANPLSYEQDDFFPRLENEALVPYRNFLKAHANHEQVRFFVDLGKKMWPAEYRERFGKESLMVLIPAFTLSQLTEAFKIGLLLYLPFVAIDLVVSNILLAMGMMMVSPMTISLPFKLLIFILMGGWQKLISQLVISYT